MTLGNYTIKTAYDPKPIPIREYDWVAWCEGLEEWKYGTGPTELDAVVSLRNELNDAGEQLGIYYVPVEHQQQRISELEAQLAAEKETWRCFHCGFETANRAEAEAHFGDRDDAEEFKPLCRWWASMSPKERGETLQDTIEQLNSERDENAVLRSKIDGLEYRIHGIVSEIKSFKPFRNCESIHQVFYVYDSMEGRMLVAEEKLAERDRQLKVAREALTIASKSLNHCDSIAWKCPSWCPRCLVDKTLSDLKGEK